MLEALETELNFVIALNSTCPLSSALRETTRFAAHLDGTPRHLAPGLVKRLSDLVLNLGVLMSQQYKPAASREAKVRAKVRFTANLKVHGVVSEPETDSPAILWAEYGPAETEAEDI